MQKSHHKKTRQHASSNDDHVEGVHGVKKNRNTKCTQQTKGIEYETACSREGTTRLKEKQESVGMEGNKKFGIVQHTLNLQS